MSDAQPAAMEMQTVQRQLQALDRHLAELEASMQELHTAIATLDGLAGDGPIQARVPVGGGVRVAATVDPSHHVTVDLGDKYSAEMPVPAALERLRDRLRNTEAAFRSTSDEADKTANRYQALQMQAMSADASSSS